MNFVSLKNGIFMCFASIFFAAAAVAQQTGGTVAAPGNAQGATSTQAATSAQAAAAPASTSAPGSTIAPGSASAPAAVAPSSAGPIAPISTLPVRPISFGLQLGNPAGISMRYTFNPQRAIDLGFGPDYFGSPRMQLDYVWFFHAFRSTTISEYAGPGLAVAFAKGINTFYTHEWEKESFSNTEDRGFGIGGRAILGMCIMPAASRMEFFVESGPMVPIAHYFDLDFDGAVGVRYRL